MSYEDYSKAEQIFYFNLGRLALDANDSDVETTKQEVEDICNIWAAEDFSYLSPIEAIMLSELLFLTDSYNRIQYDAIPGVSKFVDCFSFQPQVKCGIYTADFLITMHGPCAAKHVVVECDGHDFHQKTKEQAAHDKKRDRWFTKKGMVVLRFTGSEIFKDVGKCGEDITTTLSQLFDEYILPAHLRRA